MKTVFSLWKGRISRPETMREMASRVAEQNGVTLLDLRSPSRAPKLVEIRWQAMAVISETGRFSTSQIGRFFNRDHTTVIHGLRRLRGRVAA